MSDKENRAYADELDHILKKSTAKGITTVEIPNTIPVNFMTFKVNWQSTRWRNMGHAMTTSLHHHPYHALLASPISQTAVDVSIIVLLRYDIPIGKC